MKINASLASASKDCRECLYNHCMITKKFWAELADVLRKRRNHRTTTTNDDASDEDLGLPRSPITPHRNPHPINQSSEGSLSLLSMVSSDMDDESNASVIAAAAAGMVNISGTSSSQKWSDSSRNSTDEVDLDASFGSTGSARLSHSAARHKMAIRPNKKKGPSRHLRKATITDGPVLPPTPEDNEDSVRLQTETISGDNSKLKSQSLPPGMTSKILEKHSSTEVTTKMTTIINNISNSLDVKTTSSKSSMYVNQTLSKSFDFDKTHAVGDGGINNSAASTLDRKADETSFFRRLLNRSTKKKKSIDESDAAAVAAESEISTTPLKETVVAVVSAIPIPIRSSTVPPPIKAKPNVAFKFDGSPLKSSPLNTYVDDGGGGGGTSINDHKPLKPLIKNEKPRSGPASRQRFVPQEISVSVTATTDTSLEKLSPKKTEKSFSFSVPSSLIGSDNKLVEKTTSVIANDSITTTTKFIKSNSSPHHHRSDEQLSSPLPPPTSRFKKISSDDIATLSSTTTTMSIKSIWPEDISRTQRILPTLIPEEQSSPRRKAVEKSKSFRFYTETQASTGTEAGQHHLLQGSANMPSLPDLSLRHHNSYQPSFMSGRGVKSAIDFRRNRDLPSTTPMTPTTSCTSTNNVVCDNKFEINDNNLIKPKESDVGNTAIYTKNIILTTSNKSPTVANVGTGKSNINQIEDNIDKIMKSSFVTVLKKSSECSEPAAKPRNVSVTAITGPDLSSTTKNLTNEWPSKDSSSSSSQESATSSPISCTSPINIINGPKSLDGGGSNSVANLPEFMKIQLNRVDAAAPTAVAAARPKSHHFVVVATTKGVAETNGRRFSNESVEITDTKPMAMPSIVRQSNFTKSMESVSMSSSSQCSLNSRSNSSSCASSLTASPLTPMKKPFQGVTDSTVSEHLPRASPAASVERRQSIVSKYERKIEELRAAITSNDAVAAAAAAATAKSESRKSSLGDEAADAVVVLRKKSLKPNVGSAATDDQPELMKVFARRSLKIKDTDDYLQGADESSSGTKKSMATADSSSDKENQSSSEEKLDKLSVVGGGANKMESADENCGGSSNNNNNNNKNIDGFRKSALISPKPFVGVGSAAANRFANVVNYRSTAAFMDTRKVTPPFAAVVGQHAASTEQNNNATNSLNNNRHTIPMEKVVAELSETTSAAAADGGIVKTAAAEFKGILQRRAEWEKRAKEAFK